MKWRAFLKPGSNKQIVQGKIQMSYQFKFQEFHHTKQNELQIKLLEDGLSFDDKKSLMEELFEGNSSEIYFSLHQAGFIHYALIFDADNALEIEIHQGSKDSFDFPPYIDLDYKWSRFALIRKNRDNWCIESPLALSTINIIGHQLWEMMDLMTDKDKWNALLNIASLPQKQFLSECMSLLVSIGILIEEKNNQEDQPALKMWEIHDLYFHSRSRLGRHSNGMGGNYRFKGEEPSLPAVREKHSGPIIPLQKPNPYWYTNRDLTFNQVIEYRKSYRLNGTGIVTLTQLSEFLFRSVRIRSLDSSNPMMEISNRPYPNGGASYELELYLTIHRCHGLKVPGFYYYCPLNHHLVLLKEYDADVHKNMEMATWSTGQNFPPAVLINIAARFQRVSWKYEGIAYALILKNTGVLYHQLYLVATAMGLNPCGVGVGDSDHFANLSGLDYTKENSVGELILNGVYTPN